MFFLNINLIDEIFLINQFLNSNRSKFCYSNAGHQFCTETLSLFLMLLLHLQKNHKCNTKPEYFSIKYDLSIILSMSDQNSGVILSKVYYMNKTYYFYEWIQPDDFEGLFYISAKCPNVTQKQHVFL